jgi:hypothetical protein
MTPTPWLGSFKVEGDPSGGIRLEQVDTKHFELHSTVRYIGRRTGLEDYLSEDALTEIRVVSPEKLPTTDLTSVPGVLRWFAGRYGVHTPAALIHDWLIPQPSTPVIPGMTDQYADRYFRFMLEDLGVPVIRRWLMWAAVAARSRWQQGLLQKMFLTVWFIASVAGMAAFIYGWVDGNILLVVAAALAPFIFALLWQRQYGAGIVAAYSAPWIVPPTIFALAGYGVYLMLEWIVGIFTPSRPHT